MLAALLISETEVPSGETETGEKAPNRDDWLRQLRALGGANPATTREGVMNALVEILRIHGQLASQRQEHLFAWTPDAIRPDNSLADLKVCR